MVPALVLLGWMIGAQPPDDPCRLGTERFQAGDPAGALPWVEQCVQEHLDDLEWRLRLCSLYQQLGRDQDLFQAALEGTRRFPDEKRFFLTAGIRAARAEDYQRAITLLSEARGRWPSDPVILSNLAGVYLVRGLDQFDREQYPAAEADLKEALQLEPNHVEALLNLGRLQHNLLRREEALSTFQRIRELAPDTPELEFHLGVVLFSLQQNAAALEALNEELRRNPGLPAGYFFRGLVLKAMQRYPEALSDLASAARVMPDDREVFFEYGRCLESLERYDEAERAYRTSSELDRSQPKALFALGQLLQRRGRTAEAKSVIDEARKRYVEMVREDRADFQFKSTRVQ